MHASHEIVVHIAALLKIKQIRYVAQIKIKTHKRKKKGRKERRLRTYSKQTEQLNIAKGWKKSEGLRYVQAYN